MNFSNRRAASAAGLKQVALAGSALALVMGPANATIVTNTLGSPITVDLNTASSHAFDLNGDGINDFTVSSTGGCGPTATCSISVAPWAGNQVYIDGFAPVAGGLYADYSPSPAAFESSFYGGNPFKYMSPNPGNLVSSVDQGAPNGDWSGDGSTGVVGLEFTAGGKDYLGFIGGTVSNPSHDTSASITFNTFGYDNSQVPEPATLSLLAMGMVGVGALRRRRKAVKG